MYFLLNKIRWITVAKGWLVISSLFFYSWWNVSYLPLIIGSMVFNYIIGKILTKWQFGLRKGILALGIAFNVGLLGYYKYSNFFLTNMNAVFTTNVPLLKLALPLAISFFTFQQIAYLVDAYRQETKQYDFLSYALFVTFFPQLIAGPIVHHKEMMPQFEQLRNKLVNYRNIATGLFVFCIGLFKKVVIADTFAIWATYGFDEAVSLTMLEGWIVSLSYTFQLYFDFSGYADMAIGIALLFNIRLPINFHSPYKATSIQDFWRRWHMTLGRFLTQYVYIPLGGNRLGKFRTYLNLFFVFLISGLWHGAGWTFVFWGFLHGMAIVIHRLWKANGYTLNRYIAWFLTFQFVNISWVFFRAQEWADAMKVLKAMFVFPEALALPTSAEAIVASLQVFPMVEYGEFATLCIAAFLVIVICAQNSMDAMMNFRPNFTASSVLMVFVAGVLLVSFLVNTNSEFLYFNF
nr:MBOAT family protein [Desulfuribacillus stibiiarsenatis]